MKRYRILLFALLAMFMVSSCQKNNADDKVEEGVPVQVETVALGNVMQTLSYSGDIKAEFEVKVFSKIPDRIEKFFVDDGDAIKKGEPIAKILATTIEQAVRQAEAALVAAKAQEANVRVEYERAQRLYKESAMSKQQYDGVDTQYEAAKAQLEQAEAALVSTKSQFDDATITAPISGIIGKRYYETGDMASPSMPVVSIVQMDQVKVTFDAPEEDLGRLAVGQPSKVIVKSYSDRNFEGKIVKISPILDPMTRMAEVEVLIKNPAHLLKPGMFSRVEVTTGVIENSMVVPRFATIENTATKTINGKDEVIRNYYVFVVDSSKASQRKLNVKYVNHKWIAVDSGIVVGEKLVVAGQNNLREGLPVIVSNEEEEQL